MHFMEESNGSGVLEEVLEEALVGEKESALVGEVAHGVDKDDAVEVGVVALVVDKEDVLEESLEADKDDALELMQGKAEEARMGDERRGRFSSVKIDSSCQKFGKRGDILSN